ncbi:MAG: type II toxin-antitoxin system HicB family antitoxin [Spirochaetes bacterium]|nr:type II toxin-antitoxin system HicB family antitoxin [Spirochaetota bacterium]
MYYTAVIWIDSDDTYSVRFPDLPGCFSTGDTLDAARASAREALNLYLEGTPVKAFDKPKAIDNLDGYNDFKSRYIEAFPIKVNRNIAFALKLRWQREFQGLTQAAMAQRLGVRLSAYQRLENPEKSNDTLKTVQQLEEAISEELLTV